MALNFSKNQTSILEIFFNDPDKSYYLRELGRMLNKEPGVFQKAINKLVENGILESEYRANSRFFKLNKQHFLYLDLKSIFLKTVGVQAILKKALENVKNIKVAFVFGSFAKNKEDSFSDIDLMIVGTPNEDDLINKFSLIETKLNREINYSIFSLNDFKEGIKKKEVFLEEIIENPKIFLIGNKNDLEKIN